MLKLPGRGKKSVNKPGFLSPYKQLISKVSTGEKIRKEIKDAVLVGREASKKASGVIRLNKVSKWFGNNKVLTNVSFEIKLGKILGIIGVSGSGKTTILRLLIGFYKPTSGVVTFNGENINKQIKVVNRNFGFATQEDSFYKDLTVEENLMFFGRLYGLKKNTLESNVAAIMKLVDLYDARNVLGRNLSGGMERRLDIACALINDPTVLILDEPTEDLDPHLRASLLELIKKINQKGTTVIFTTHLLNEAEFLCDEVAVLSGGGVLKMGTVIDLRKAYNAGDKDKLILADIRKPTLTEVFSSLTKNAKKKIKE